jgi:hypothetical protein
MTGTQRRGSRRGNRRGGALCATEFVIFASASRFKVRKCNDGELLQAPNYICNRG